MEALGGIPETHLGGRLNTKEIMVSINQHNLSSEKGTTMPECAHASWIQAGPALPAWRRRLLATIMPWPDTLKIQGFLDITFQLHERNMDMEGSSS